MKTLLLTFMMLFMCTTACKNKFTTYKSELPEHKGKVIVMKPLILIGPVEEVFWAFTEQGDTIVLPLKVTCDINIKRASTETY